MSRSSSDGPFWHIGAILAVACSLRFFRLDAGLWYDEIATLVDFVRLPLGELVTTYTSPNNHILFSAAAHLSTAVFGESAWALRLPAAVAGVVSIWAIYWFACRLTTRFEALATAALMAVSYHHVWFSQNARGYTALLLWVILLTGLFVDGTRAPSWRTWGGYGIVAALAMYTHLSAVFVLAAHGIVYLASEIRRSVAARHSAGSFRYNFWPLGGFALGALLTLLLYAVLIPQMVTAFSDQAGADSVNVKVATWTNPLWTVVEVVRGLHLGAVSGAVIAVAGLLIAVGWLDYLRRETSAACLMVLNAPITLAVLMAIEFHIWPRYFFVNLGFVLLVLVRGLVIAGELIARRLDVRTPPPIAWKPVAALLAILALATMLPRNYAVPKQDYRGAKAFIETLAGPTDGVFTVGLATLAYEELYAPEWGSVESAAALSSERLRYDNTWLVYSFPTHMQTAHADVLVALENDFDLMREFPGTLGDGEIYVWRSR